ncbi:MAG: hypothetical protein IKS04_02640 [Clostridia bacterium]|nr:hypothetical protein [Clostridia bacterium]
MKNFKKISAILLSVLILSLSILPSLAADDAAALAITNPYEGADFETFNQYKTALHTHTNASDGSPTLKESIERHCETGFDIVATTDHGTVNYTWETPNENKLIHGALNLFGRSKGELEYLGKSGSFANGTEYTYSSENGDDYLDTSDGRRIMRVPYGIEQNAVSANAHVNSWFADYHNNSLTTYNDALSGVQKTNGVCVINHPGEYSKARYEIRSADAYNEGVFAYRYFINKIASLLNKYDACLGIDVNSKGDGRTRFDRILWDNLLGRFSANGENVFAICSSDAHQLDKIDTGFIYALMPSLNSVSLRKALENGWFFGASHCIGNPDELGQIADSLREFYGETEIYNNVKAAYDEMIQRADEIENGKRDADDDLSVTYSVLDEDGYCSSQTEPAITSIAVDSNDGTITVNTENALIVRWISNGKLIATQKAGEATIALEDFKDSIGNYIRAEVFGEGGILYTQAFLINAEQNAGKSNPVDGGFMDFGILDCLFGIFQNWKENLGRMIRI